MDVEYATSHIRVNRLLPLSKFSTVQILAHSYGSLDRALARSSLVIVILHLLPFDLSTEVTILVINSG